MTNLLDILKLFFHLGLVAFGAPAARSLDLVRATSLIPKIGSFKSVCLGIVLGAILVEFKSYIPIFFL